MLFEDEDVLVTVNLVYYLNYNQDSIVQKYWIHPF
jgi:hypothetical protein